MFPQVIEVGILSPCCRPNPRPLPVKTPQAEQGPSVTSTDAFRRSIFNVSFRVPFSLMRTHFLTCTTLQNMGKFLSPLRRGVLPSALLKLFHRDGALTRHQNASGGGADPDEHPGGLQNSDILFLMKRRLVQTPFRATCPGPKVAASATRDFPSAFLLALLCSPP